MIQFRIENSNQGAICRIQNQKEKDGVFYADFVMELQEKTVPQKISLSWDIPSKKAYSVWSPNIRMYRVLGKDYYKQKTVSRLASWMPLHTILSAEGKNIITIALSDALNPTMIANGVCEETACIECVIDLFTQPVAPLDKYEVTIRIDMRDIDYYDSANDVTEWWEKECGYTPANVPEHAKLPMNSLWYSYHQNLDVEDIIKECVLSKKIGMDTVIVDDGWQTDNVNKGYAYCGDWEVASSKIPNMAEFVKRVHNTGMKFMLWYSVPFIGVHSKNYERFKDMLLDKSGNDKDYWSLDPRYKEVRDFLIEIYTTALKEWDLDGFKLDFIDSFVLQGKSLEYDSRRDYQSLEDAIDRLMTDIMMTLRSVKPDIMIEFRQTYVGPAIRKYGNMLRVGDCPNDAYVNRQDVVNLRLTSGNTAVHSDMLMWHYDAPVEYAALQLASVLYSVPQVSMKIAKLSDEHKKTLEYYLSFWKEHRSVLLDGKLCARHPESLYSLVWTQKDEKAIFTAYTEKIIPCKGYKEVIAVNSTGDSELLIQDANGKKYRVVNCMGEELESGVVLSEIETVKVPMAGMIFLQ